jgi:hypothetical protein
MALLRGAKPSPRHRLASAVPHKPIGTTPNQWLWLPKQLSMWDNDVDGDCVTAEEAMKCGCPTPGNPGEFITDQTVLAWATKNGVLNGADLVTVMDIMQTAGFSQDGKLYNDGNHNSVDWTDDEVLRNAIAQSPVKIGVAADQLQNVVGDPPKNGWFATGFQEDGDVDHCVNLCGFGTIAWLAQQLGVDVPYGADGTAQAYALFTWKSIGIITPESMRAITGEAWLRTPATVIGTQSES